MEIEKKKRVRAIVIKDHRLVSMYREYQDRSFRNDIKQYMKQ